jgi:hypothetical protein
MGAAVEWAGSHHLWVIQEHSETAKKVVQEEGERRSSAMKLVDVSRSALILSGNERKGRYAGPEESRRWGQWGMGGRGSFPGGW